MHPSGHASSGEVFAAISSIRPKLGVLPLHTPSVKYFEHMLKQLGIQCLHVERKEKAIHVIPLSLRLSAGYRIGVDIVTEGLFLMLSIDRAILPVPRRL